MLFTKTQLYKRLKLPIDFGRNMSDGKRIFGDNKTWIGFISMILFCSLFQVAGGMLCNNFRLNEMNDLYRCNDNNIVFSMCFGCLIGFIYMLCELPNSFIKRRLNIAPGTTKTGLVGAIFFIIDQIDSLVGVMFVLYLFSDFGLLKYVSYVCIGAATHIVINSLLYLMKVRKNF